MEELAAERPDVVKIWVDDRFGDFKKTPIEVSRPIIDGAHKHGIKAIAHVFYLNDAKQLAAAGLDAFGHSVRDRAVDDELIQLMKKTRHLGHSHALPRMGDLHVRGARARCWRIRSLRAPSTAASRRS